MVTPWTGANEIGSNVFTQRPRLVAASMIANILAQAGAIRCGRAEQPPIGDEDLNVHAVARRTHLLSGIVSQFAEGLDAILISIINTIFQLCTYNNSSAKKRPSSGLESVTIMVPT